MDSLLKRFRDCKQKFPNKTFVYKVDKKFICQIFLLNLIILFQYVQCFKSMSSLTRRPVVRILRFCYSPPVFTSSFRHLGKFSDRELSKKDARYYASCYKTLELEPESSQDLVRRQYIRLVKKFHPDSAKTDSEREIFQKAFHRVDEVSLHVWFRNASSKMCISGNS